MAWTIIEGDNYGNRRRCDPKCHLATGPRCTRACAGAHHGNGRTQLDLFDLDDQERREGDGEDQAD